MGSGLGMETENWNGNLPKQIWAGNFQFWAQFIRKCIKYCISSPTLTPVTVLVAEVVLYWYMQAAVEG